MKSISLYIFVFAVLVGCATHRPAPPLPSPVTEKTYEAATDSAGEEVIKRRQRYLEILYEQSIEPYYGTPKWSESCLRETQIGKVSENLAISTLYLDAKGNPGGCPGTPGNRKIFLVLVYCSEKKLVREVQFDFNAGLIFERSALCAQRS